MKQNYQTSLLLKFILLFTALFLFTKGKSFAQVTLGASPYTQNFNSIGGGLPTGWTVRTGASASALGTAQTLNTGTISWGTTTGQFANCASANSPSASADVSATQATRIDRALAVRQTSAFGDNGAAFVLQINNTTGLTAFNLSFKLMELDPGTAGRTATWNVDYGFGAVPTSFFNATTVPATLTTTTGSWGITNVTVNFGNALDNNGGPVWIRLATKSATTGSNNRPVSAIDDYSLSYLAATPTLTAGLLTGFGNICVGSTVGPNSFSLTGINLDGSAVVVGPLAGYTFSDAFAGSYLATASPTYSAPSLSATIYVKFTPSAIQSYDGNIPVSGGSAASISAAVTGSGADNPPTVTSGSAGSITAFTATVSGSIPDIGCSGLTGYGIEYSQSNGFTNGTGTPVSSTNLVGINFSSALSGLSPNTVYYYHAYATNSSAGTAYGLQGTFTTANLDAPNATPATSVANHDFDANWDAVTGATGYRLDVATTNTFYTPSTTSIVEWNFPNAVDDNIADGGIALNLAKTLNLFGNVTAVTYVPTASGPTSAATTASGGWASGSGADYWEVSMVTAGYYNLTVSSAQRSSPTGPRDFKLQYKIGAGGTYTDVPGGTVTVGNDWTTGLINSVSLPAVCENKISVFLRWIMSSNTAVNASPVGIGGTSAIDNISVIGNAGTFVSGYNNLFVAGLTQPVSGLAANATYFYRVRATGALSTSDNSNVITVTTTCTPAAINACPLDIVQCDNNIATWTDPTATGDPAATVVCSPLSGSTFSLGTTPVTCTATNGCGSPSSCSFNVTINESPVINACPGDISQCNPVATWTDPTSTGTPAATVVCSPLSGSTFSVGTTSVTCTATNSCNTSSCSFNVTILAPSTAPASATSNANYGQICIGAQVILSVTGGTLGAGAGYVWYEGGCGTGGSIGTGPSITITPATTGVHNYFARIEGTCNNTTCVSVAVSVISAPPSGTVHYTASIAVGCVSAPASAFSVNAVAGSAFYNWSSSQAGVRFNGNPSPFQTTVPTVNVTFVSLPAAGASGWSICVFGGNACGNTNTICTWVRAKVTQPGAIIGNVTGCPSFSGVYSVVAVTGADTYTWSITGAAGINGGGPTLTTPSNSITVNFLGGWTSGTLSVYASMSCGYNSIPRTKSISNAPPQPGTMTGPTSVCAAVNPNNYSVVPVTGATSYIWTCSVLGALLTPSSNTCSIVFPAVIPGGSTVCVTAVSSCGASSPARCKGIASGVPGTPGNILGQTTSACNTTGVSYAVSSPSAGASSYLWSITGGASIQLPNNLSGVSIDFPNNYTSGVITVNGVNACGNGGTRTLSVTGAPALPGVFTVGNALPCSTTVETYTTAGSAGATSYNWSVPATSTILSSPPYGPSILVQIGNVSGNITVSANTLCGTSAARTFAISIGCRQSQVMSSADNAVSVYPNPATEKATVKFTAASAAQVRLNMTNVLGQSVLTTEIAATEGTNTVDLDFSTLAKGVYMLSVMSGDNNEQIRVVVE